MNDRTARWTAVRLIRWPEQAAERDWCAARGLPRVLLVDEGAEAPRQHGDHHERVLTEPVTREAIESAVEALAWEPVVPVGPRRHAPRAGILGRVAALV